MGLRFLLVTLIQEKLIKMNIFKYMNNFQITELCYIKTTACIKQVHFLKNYIWIEITISRHHFCKYVMYVVMNWQCHYHVFLTALKIETVSQQCSKHPVQDRPVHVQKCSKMWLSWYGQSFIITASDQKFYS